MPIVRCHQRTRFLYRAGFFLSPFNGSYPPFQEGPPFPPDPTLSLFPLIQDHHNTSGGGAPSLRALTRRAWVAAYFLNVFPRKRTALPACPFRKQLPPSSPFLVADLTPYIHAFLESCPLFFFDGPRRCLRRPPNQKETVRLFPLTPFRGREFSTLFADWRGSPPPSPLFPLPV